MAATFVYFEISCQFANRQFIIASAKQARAQYLHRGRGGVVTESLLVILSGILEYGSVQVDWRDVIAGSVAMLVSFSSLLNRSTPREGWSVPSQLDVTNSAAAAARSTRTPSSFSASSENVRPENTASSDSACNNDIVLWTGTEKGELDGVAITLLVNSKAFWNDNSVSIDTISVQSPRISEREDTSVVRFVSGTAGLFLHRERSPLLSQKVRLKPNTPPNRMPVVLPRSTGSPRTSTTVPRLDAS
eukprot:30736-Pelagococcus_subviridis.AAC.2